MILIVLAAVCALSVPLAGGHLGRLAELRLRLLWAAPVALIIQLVIITVAPQGNPTVHSAVHIGTYVLIGAFILANLRIPGAGVIGFGTLLNATAIIANGGVMPASLTAQRIAGLIDHSGFNNSAFVAHAHLQWLGDVIPIPGPPHLRNVLSIGDVVIFIGMLRLLHSTCGRSVPQLIHLTLPLE
jgi:hypothetical protein